MDGVDEHPPSAGGWGAWEGGEKEDLHCPAADPETAYLGCVGTGWHPTIAHLPKVEGRTVVPGTVTP